MISGLRTDVDAFVSGVPVESFFARVDADTTVEESKDYIFKSIDVKAGETFEATWNVCVKVLQGNTAFDAIIRISKDGEYEERVEAPVRMSAAAA